MDGVDVVILALATWRLASLFADEEGPFGLFERFRDLIGVRYDAFSERIGSNEFARGLLCKWCSSVWFGIALTLIYVFWPRVVWFTLPLALSAASVALGEAVEWFGGGHGV